MQHEPPHKQQRLQPLLQHILPMILLLLVGIVPTVNSLSSENNNNNQSLLQIVDNNADLQQLSKLFNEVSEQINVKNQLNVDNFTILAPLDSSFINLSKPYSFYLSYNDWSMHAIALAAYHIVPGLYENSSSLFLADNDTAIATLQALPQTTFASADYSDPTLQVNETTQTVGGNQGKFINGSKSTTQANNGYIHFVDRVLLPDYLFNTTIISFFQDYLASEYSYFSQLLNVAHNFLASSGQLDLLGELASIESQYGWTMIVPTNAAIEAIEGYASATGVVAAELVLYHLADVNVNTVPLPTRPFYYFTYGSYTAWYANQNPQSSNKNSYSTLVAVNLYSNITKTYLTGNGVIHIVDYPLFFPTISDQFFYINNIGAANLTKFFNLINATMNNLINNISASITVFAPADSAFNNHTDGGVLVDRLVSNPQWARHLVSFVRNFVYGDVILDYSMFQQPKDITMLSGYDVSVELVGDVVEINSIICDVTNIAAINGDLAIIRDLYTPDWYVNSIFDILSNTANFTTVVTLIKQSSNKLRRLLNATDGGPLTFLAPDNDAFKAVRNLSSFSENEIATVLMGHVFNGSNIFFDDLNKTKASAVSKRWNVTFEDDRAFINGGELYYEDNLANNGVVHAIRKVLIPASLKSQKTLNGTNFTKIPSGAPSVSPSTHRSGRPSTSPSAQPSMKPSLSPTMAAPGLSSSAFYHSKSNHDFESFGMATWISITTIISVWF